MRLSGQSGPDQKSVRVAITDPHPAVIAGVRDLLFSEPRVVVACEHRDREQLFSAAKEAQADVILSGHPLRQPGAGGSADLVAGDIPCILMTDRSGTDLLSRAFRAGYRGVFYKTDDLDSLLEAIRTVCQGILWFQGNESSALVEALLRRFQQPRARFVAPAGLSERQQYVISLVGQGLSNLDISDIVRVSQATVAHDLTGIYRAFGVRDRFSLLLKLGQTGLPGH